MAWLVKVFHNVASKEGAYYEYRYESIPEALTNIQATTSIDFINVDNLRKLLKGEMIPYTHENGAISVYSISQIPSLDEDDETSRMENDAHL